MQLYCANIGVHYCLICYIAKLICQCTSYYYINLLRSFHYKAESGVWTKEGLRTCMGVALPYKQMIKGLYGTYTKHDHNVMQSRNILWLLLLASVNGYM